MASLAAFVVAFSCRLLGFHEFDAVDFQPHWIFAHFVVFEDLVEVVFQCRFRYSREGCLLLVVGLVADHKVEVDYAGWVFIPTIGV